jgi:integrase/recombinase XerC
MTLHDAIARFARHLQANSCSVHTVRSYACDLRSLERFLEGGMPVKRITVHALNAFLTSNDAKMSVSGKPKGQGAINRLRAVLRSFFRWLFEAGQIQTNPAATLRVRSYRQPTPKMLADADRKKLLDGMCASADPFALRDQTIVELMLGTGIRLAEAVSLDVGDIDLAAGAITINPKGYRKKPQ